MPLVISRLAKLILKIMWFNKEHTINYKLKITDYESLYLQS